MKFKGLTEFLQLKLGSLIFTGATSEIGSPGSDANLVTEKAIRTALSALSTAEHTHEGLVTNGDAHDHNGGDGAQIAYSSLSGTPTLGTAAAQDISYFALAVHTHSGGTGLPNGYDSILITYKDASTITIKAGGQALSADGTVIYTISADTDVSFSQNLSNGLSEAANTKYRLWIGKNAAGNTEIVLSPSETNTPNQIGTASALLNPRLLRWCLRNDGNSNLLSFQIDAGFYRYTSVISFDGSDPTQIYSGTAPTSDISLNGSAFAPADAPILLDVWSPEIYTGSNSYIGIILSGQRTQTHQDVAAGYVRLAGEIHAPYAFIWHAGASFATTRICLVGYWG